ncbi:MAG: class I SAM-dependent methyltransferase [Planctomycetota bacterium]|jgi:SAM-dependent methyltransferase|nr:class I SAM-dependent methyltransferase [Planctomycetota bacterium]MDP7134307.1 class I SAM-dependent methyltransferase [Planctomycetota bacterium]
MRLSTSQDACGHMIYDHFHGTSTVEIVERDDGLIMAGRMDAAHYLSEFDDWPEWDREAAKHVHGRVLDIGCGGGRWCLYFQQKGHDVLGIDVSPLAVKTCKERGIRKARVLPITQVSRRLGEFDTILMMGNNFGLFGSRKRAKWLLPRLRNMTGKNGLIIAQSLDPYATSDKLHLDYHRRNRKRGRMSGQLRFRIRYRNYKTPFFDYLLVSRKEMEELLEGTGWRIERIIESNAASYTAVIRKTEE